MQEFIAEQTDAGVRADVYVTDKYPSFTRSALEALFDQKLVRVNGEPAKASRKIKDGDKVQVDETLLKLEPPVIKLPIIYEDDDVVVMDKPAGMLTHSKGALNLEPTVAGFLKTKITDSELTGNRAGIVHRLDRGTSGVIISAKNAAAQAYLQGQFSARKVKKTYLAVVEGAPEPDEAMIDAPIERNPRRPQTFRVGAGGKPAQTRYKVLKMINKGGREYSLLELNPVTGRTHQLRVHLSYIGNPIAGDPVYGHDGDKPMLLHAASLELTLPGGQRKIFEAKTPANFKGFIDG